ncbi:uncharacterized protein LOC133294044 isoform X2 [Gastrolobium bilobum]|uniref:uncharacterized protein LOC133294044 isoform X2 n=1 Tax=Gastrolobium bilobum TaxID=150636 RepID=UPI002AB301A0|nr:uncharacterized protein LOC133294044 isoform X2 [Gastrolobium bilobum]
MSGCSKSPKNDQHSIKYRGNQHKGAPFEADLSCVDYSPSLSNKENKQCYERSQLKSREILSTPQLISAIGQIWDSASRPLSFLLSKEKVNRDDKGFPKEKILDSIDEKRNGLVYTSNYTTYYPVNMGDTGYGSQIVQEKMDFPKASDNNSGNAHKGLNYHAKVTEPENLKTNSPEAGGCFSIDTSTPALANESDVCGPDLIVHEGRPLSNDVILDTRKVSPLCSDYVIQPVPYSDTDVGACHTLSSSVNADYHINSSSTCNSTSVQCQHEIDNNELMEIQRRQFSDVTDDEPKVQIFSTTHQKPGYSLAKQEHAVSGALAGICVSLCLHPIDTIKTVIQSCHAEQRSLFYIGKSIVSDRGLPGLYRGITTNIACSAPISAVYTFTYESVKAALLPYLPKEYYSFAHCVGGGCASIATSFIFTPSERVKQQMQVGSHYRNCWEGLIGIIRNGGFPSLYAGWGAVLCRNVPHSIIKFYTYESMKQVMPSSIQPNMFQTLVCGGLAGSTAALFTTPFDVIKTRLQTQIPGSRNQYDSVLHALYKISKSEGLKGLYRGLMPRLIMYMSQGSLFFASYEFFKRVFSLEASHPTGLYIQDDDNNVEDNRNLELTNP